ATFTRIPQSSFKGNKIVSVSCGFGSTFAVDDRSNVWAWGFNTQYQLGNGKTDNSAVPIINRIPTGIRGTPVKTFTGGSTTYVLTTEGQVYSFGGNANGEGGTGLLDEDGYPAVIKYGTPVVVSPLLRDARIVDIAVGGAHALMLMETGDVVSVGNNYNGELGCGVIPDETRSYNWVRVEPQWPPSDRVVRVAAGGNHSMVILESGLVYCFGNNSVRQCGLESEGPAVMLPTAMDLTNLEGRKVVSAAGGQYHTVLLDDTGISYGAGYAQYGAPGTGSVSTVPVATPMDMSSVLGGTVVTRVYAWENESMILLGARDGPPPDRRVLTWLCLERCSEVSIDDALDQLAQYTDMVTDVSFEAYDLGYNSTLVWNRFTDVYPDLVRMGYRAWPMITTSNPTMLRQLFEDPQPFISRAVSVALDNGYTGYNMDFEPSTGNMTDEDGADYAAFVTMFADALHRAGMELQVIVYSWDSAFIKGDLMAQTSADRIITMDTQVGTYDPTFTDALEANIEEYGTQRLGVALDTVNPVTGLEFTEADMAQRFKSITMSGVQEIDIWQSPLPDFWADYIRQWQGSSQYA
ncbi:hypothetical protein KIPB_005331, partial [Kipferlia bialata]